MLTNYQNMNKQTIITLIVILIGITGLAIWSKNVIPASTTEATSKSNLTRTEGALVVDELFYNFGKISMKDGNVSKVFKVTNNSATDTIISKVYTSCMCTAAYVLLPDGGKLGPFGMPGHGGVAEMPGHGNGPAGEVLAPGETREIEVVYDPNAHGPAGVGLIERAVILEDENKNVVEFTFRASVTP
ncbi:MAG: hypothetical protein UU10_C0027G0001 [Parcubacteria group bacterium GW2011_GWF1_40_6]|nr:MAG: hypothetical protein UU10_C0027G0001 [Parcubacteria group bacterium GW2011_GWF1_40_6]